jgi:hypothetical protein
VRLAREHDVVVSVRGGGHSVAGKAVCEGRLMVDMAAIDPSLITQNISYPDSCPNLMGQTNSVHEQPHHR